MRQKLIQHGFNTLESLLLMDEKQVDKICGAVRKGATGQANARDVPVVIQTRLMWVVLHTRHRYMTQRPLEFNNAPLEQLQEVAMWVKQLDEDPEEDTVLVYKDSLNKRAWFESIQLHLSVKKGNTGMLPVPSQGC